MQNDDRRFGGVETTDIAVGCVCRVIDRGIVGLAMKIDIGHGEGRNGVVAIAALGGGG